MLTRRAFPPLLASALAGPAGAARATPPIWAGHDIPPFLWQGAKGPEGYAFDIFQRVVKQAQVAADLRIYPWARTLRMLQEGQAQAALVVTRTPEREAQFRWLFPVGSFRYVVLTRQQLAPAPGELAALKPLRVGALRASVGRSLLEPAGITQVVEGKDFVDLLALLNRGIVDAVFGPEPALRTVAARAGGAGLQLTALTAVHEFYAAAGAAMSDPTVQRLRAAYQQLVDSGVVAQLRKQHPEAWISG